MNCLLKGSRSLLVLTRLVVHEAEVCLQLRNFGMNCYGLLVEVGSGLEITTGLGLLRRGHERFKSIGLLREQQP